MQVNRIRVFFAVLLVLFFCSNSLITRAQETDALGTYTPYSLYGIGEISKQGSAVNRAMGGIGTGVRDNRYINFMNPASITARDTLAFMLDFGVDSKNIYSTDGNVKSAFNTINVNNFVFTAPIYKKSALIVGVNPYSNIGYKLESTENNPDLVSKYGDIKYHKYGTGSINQLFIGAAMNFLKNFSIGAEYIHYFGALNRYSNVNFNSDATLRSLQTGFDYALGSSSGRVGLQYFGNVGKEKNIELTLGATYRFATKLKGDYVNFAYAKGAIVDTIVHNAIDNFNANIPEEMSFGFSVRKKDKWMFGADYMRQDWSGEYFENASSDFKYEATNSNYFKAGFEFTPNKYDIRYYMKRVTYRVGAYYEQSYLKIGANQVNAAGVTLGMSLPIHKMHNAVNLALDFGQRGSTSNNLIRERYVKFVLNISLYDVWFIKYKYM